ncbi:MAG: carbamoyl-phosphate synthase large subunit [Acidobacteriota bacterium]
MPKRVDINSILVIGSGPIVIGQACEFDYSGTQAVKALRQEGYRVVLVNSNPATIMTDPEVSPITYLEPLVPEVVERVIAAERPDALLPTVGGQTGLNLSVRLEEDGILARYGVEMIGASPEAVRIAEDRQRFRTAMETAGLPVPAAGYAHSLEEALKLVRSIGYPAIVRPSYTLGGGGAGVAYNVDEFKSTVQTGLRASPVAAVLIEESVIGWKEFELEVMRDGADNFVVVCSIENLDPMGVHTGDSITVAPAITLSDREYQRMRDWARRVISTVGVETGGSNIQFAVRPSDGRMLVIEMNPRVSRSSALASKATGFPIAKIAAKLAVGYTLDEIPNDITRETPASFEPTIDYVVLKVPRFAFEKFPGSDPTLTMQMKSVGEVMSIGRTFRESLQKALRSLETGRLGWGMGSPADATVGGHRGDPAKRASGGVGAAHLTLDVPRHAALRERLKSPLSGRLDSLWQGFHAGMQSAELAVLTGYDRWFVDQFESLYHHERALWSQALADLDADSLWTAKRAGYSDAQLALFTGSDGAVVRARRERLGVRPTFRRVDTCAAEFVAHTPYLYSTYDAGGLRVRPDGSTLAGTGAADEAAPSSRPKVLVLGGGPNRIGQGIEFNYCCCHAAFAARSAGYESIMVNCNPETVSTDYDTADRLYFEPVSLEEVLAIIERERPEGTILQFGGQTPLKLALPLHQAGVKILGTPPEAIDLAEDRQRFSAFLRQRSIAQPPFGTATNEQQAVQVADRLGYPVLVRPSYVLGGRAMAIVYGADSLRGYIEEAVEASPDRPVLIDKFLESALEIDVDALCDGDEVVICGILQHIEEAGIHSGDSACVVPPIGVPPKVLDLIRDWTRRLAIDLGVTGLMNVQFAVVDGTVYVLEVNPRASRTVPFLAKATGVPLAGIATRLLLGAKLSELGVRADLEVHSVFVKMPVFPFDRFPGYDPLLGPEMRSTGEVMGAAPSFGIAFAKAAAAAGLPFPTVGTAFISVQDRDKPAALAVAEKLLGCGFRLLATRGTEAFLAEYGFESTFVYKVNEGRPNIADRIVNGEVQLIINTPLGKKSRYDETAIRRTAIAHRVLCITNIAGAVAAVEGIRALLSGDFPVAPLRDYQTEAVS